MVNSEGERSLLGFALDPLGLWRDSALVKLDSLDRRVLDSQAKIVSALESFAPAGDLTRDEQLAVARRVLEKAVGKRELVAKTGSKLATFVVKQTSERLKRGSREDEGAEVGVAGVGVGLGVVEEEKTRKSGGGGGGGSSGGGNSNSNSSNDRGNRSSFNNDDNVVVPRQHDNSNFSSSDGEMNNKRLEMARKRISAYED